MSLVPEDDVLAVLGAQPAEVLHLAASITPAQETHRYAPGKWSVRELLGHVGDSERVFGYRAFCISRGEQASLPGFEEDDYIAAAAYDAQPVRVLANDFALLRESNLAVFQRLAAERWSNVGIANGNRISLPALAWIMAGHVRHHLGVLRTRYSVKV